jgi:3-deoxy-7-phosphoheptulonate synthase
MEIAAFGVRNEVKGSWTVIAGPCAAENRDQVMDTARSVSGEGALCLRAGIWKPRTRARSWQGAGEEALEWMREAREETGIAIATEVNNAATLDLALRYEFDLVWVGSRNGMSYPLLDEVGRQTAGTNCLVMIKRNMGGDLEDWLGASEYILKYNSNVLLCERGIKGFPRDTRNVLDLQVAKLAQIESGLPVIIDVSHAAGRRDLIKPMALASKAAGFDGLMVEVHPEPERALSDAKQQIGFRDFSLLMRQLAQIPRCD